MYCKSKQNIKNILKQILADSEMLLPWDIRLKNGPGSPSLSQVLFRKAEFSF